MSAAPPPRAERELVGALEGLRGAAALWVLLYHCSVRTGGEPVGPSPVARVVASGSLGVDVFFVLSGCVLTLRPVRGLGLGASFLSRRVARLLPAAWAALTFVVVAAPLIVSDPEQIRRTITPASLLANATLMGGVARLVPGYHGAIGFVGDPVLWSLTPEVLFSLLLIPAVGLLARRPVALAVAALLAGIALRALDPSAQVLSVLGPLTTAFPAGILATVAIVRAGRATPAPAGVGGAAQAGAGGGARGGAQAGAGGGAQAGVGGGAQAGAGGGVWAGARGALGGAAALGLALLAAVVLTRDPGDLAAIKHATSAGPVLPLLVAGGAAALVAGLGALPASAPARLAAAPAVRALGRWSYGIYLWHFPLIGLLVWTVGLPHDGSGRAFAEVAALALPLSILAGAASHRILEQPVRRWATRRGPNPAALLADPARVAG